MKRYRQRQTVYLIWLNWNTNTFDVQKYFLHSRKTPLPPEGCIIEKMPEDLFNRKLIELQDKVFTSWRKAKSACDLKNRYQFA